LLLKLFGFYQLTGLVLVVCNNREVEGRDGVSIDFGLLFEEFHEFKEMGFGSLWTYLGWWVRAFYCIVVMLD
jgi:hypothetical protein